MRDVRWLVGLAGAALLVLSAGGCTFFGAKGGGPLKRSELGAWAGISAQPVPEAERLSALVKGLKLTALNPFTGEYSWDGGPCGASLGFGDPREIPFTPARGMRVKGRFDPWARLLPGSRHGDWLYYAESRGDHREFYASETEWDLGALFLGYLLANDQADAFDVASRERVAAQRTDLFLTLLVCMRVRRVLPVDAEGRSGLHAAADPRKSLADTRYNLKDGTALLMGAVGWGRVNRRRYIQVLWVPIPVGNAMNGEEAK